MSASPALNLKPSHKAITTYYKELDAYARLGVTHEMAVRDAFQSLLKVCCAQTNLTFVGEWKIKRSGRSPMSVDGAIVGFDELARGYWEAKDEQDDLAKEVKRKFAVGYPKDNIIFQSPARAILYQNDLQVLDEDITRPVVLVDTLKQFFEYREPQIQRWEEAAAKFQERVPELAESVVKLIERERKTNKKFIAAFSDFVQLCRASINPNISDLAVEEMLVQHLLTERIFRNVFDNPDFTRNNIIAAEIERVISALTSRTFSRAEFLKSSDYFYRALEDTARTIDDFSHKQSFLNRVYERFFQGFSVKVADTHGIVYTPQAIVNFMVRSVEDILQKEFGKSLSDGGVHILDPFVGTGNFIIRVMREIKRTRLQEKYVGELHCCEVMLLPYYIASMNIEHEFYELTKGYRPFKGICLVDTFELSEAQQRSLFTAENTDRVEKLKQTPLFVIIGNPPYNAKQVSENDNNKNRKYPALDSRVADTYGRDSKASLKNKLRDPYVKAIRWSVDKIKEKGEGIIAFVTNNSFLDDTQFDGMRKHLAGDLDTIYVMDLGGNVRRNPRLSGTAHNVFGIQVGVSINLFIRKKHSENNPPTAKIYYARVDEFWRRSQKLDYLDTCTLHSNVEWNVIEPDHKNRWLVAGRHGEFDEFLPIGTKETKKEKRTNVKAIFKTYSLGVATNRDEWAYDFTEQGLEAKMRTFIRNYNMEVERYIEEGRGISVDAFVNNDPGFIKWTDRLKLALKQRKKLKFDPAKIRFSMYRPFVKEFLYFDNLLNQRRYQQHMIFPTTETELENRVIGITGHSQIPFSVQMLNTIPCLDVGGRPTQCFPLYVYDKDGRNRRENITDWALAQFRAHYKSRSITKLDIFYYLYALLHHPTYRTTYGTNLKRELPRIPFIKSPADFRDFVRAGKHLADVHINYESQPEYPLRRIENEDVALDWRVERMRLAKDKRSIIYNDFLTLDGIPLEAFEYRLGHRSALEWIIDQYQVSTDKRIGITHDPNREDEPDYIVKLVGKMIAVSLETVKVVRGLTELNVRTDSTVPEIKSGERQPVEVSVEMN